MLNYLLRDAYSCFIEKYVADDGFQYNFDFTYLPKDSDKRISFEWAPGIGVEKEYYSIEVCSKNFIKRCKLDIYYEDIEFSKGLKKDKIRDNCKIDGHNITSLNSMFLMIRIVIYSDTRHIKSMKACTINTMQ